MPVECNMRLVRFGEEKRVLSGIIHVRRNGLRWSDAPAEYGPAKTLYNRWGRWCGKGIIERTFLETMDHAVWKQQPTESCPVSDRMHLRL